MDKKPLVIRDPVHGDLIFESPVSEVIASPHFQRLKNIKQNGLLHLVYPGMKHSRLEHSLGTAHLAGKWFEALMFNSEDCRAQKFFPVSTDRTVDGVTLKVRDTRDLFDYMRANSRRFKSLLTLAGLIHDLGHGPLSHTLDKLKLLSLEGIEAVIKNTHLAEYFKLKTSEVEHEDFTLLYLSKIAYEAKGGAADFLHNEQNFLILSVLVHKEFRAFLLSDKKTDSGLSDMEKKAAMVLSLCVASLFDVDRFDYLRRDSYMAGVSYGHIDSDRLIHSLVPILNDQGSQQGAGFLVKARLVHALDHLLVSLYTMYAMLYFHPTNKLHDEELYKIVEVLREHHDLSMTFSRHCQATDATFIHEIDTQSKLLFSKILNRELKGNAKVVRQLYEPSPAMKSIEGDGWSPVDAGDRAMFKDSVNVWLFDSGDSVYSWRTVSLVANKLGDASYFPKIFWKHENFLKELQKLRDQLTSPNEGKASGEKG